MARQARIKPGAAVMTTDGHFGIVKDVLVRPTTHEVAQLLVEHDGSLVMVPEALILEVTGPDEVRLQTNREDTRARLSGVVSTPELGGQIRVPIHEERLIPAIRRVDLGEIRVHKHVEQAPETITQPVEREELEIERVRLDRPIDAPVETRQEDGWLIVPVMEEVLVVTKQLVLTEEVRIRTRRFIEEQEVKEIVRRERIEIEDATVPGVMQADRRTAQNGPVPQTDHVSSERQR